jgi:hypothetical protein
MTTVKGLSEKSVTVNNFSAKPVPTEKSFPSGPLC